MTAMGNSGASYEFVNRIINGAMVIDQRNAGASGTALGYTVDRFAYDASQASKLTWQQNAGSVTPPTGFSNYLGFTSSSAYSVTSTDYFYVYHRVEGFNSSDFAWGTANASPATLSFWVRSSLTGTFGGSLRNGASNYSYPFSYTISSANTWTYVTVSITGPTAGTWIGATNGIGIQVLFGLGVGSTYSGTAGTWASTNYVSATGAQSVVGTNGATWYVTGVQLEKGTTASAFDFRDYGRELMLCQRYFFQMGGAFNNGSSNYFNYGIGYNYSTANALFITQFPVTMRGQPTFTVVNATNFYVSTNVPVSSFTADQMTYQTASFLTVNNSVTAGDGTRYYGINGTTNAIQFSAEL